MNSSTIPTGAVLDPLPERYPFDPTAIVPLPAVTARFGYGYPVYFRKHVAPRLGLEFFRRNGRYFVTGAALNAAIKRYVEGDGR